MADLNIITLSLNMQALLERLNAEAENLSFAVRQTEDKNKKDCYYAALIHVEAAAQSIFRSLKD